MNPNDAILSGMLAGIGAVMPKKETRDIAYAPAPKHLVAAIRKQLRELVEKPDLEQYLGQIGRFATQADDMLMMVKSPEAVMKSEHGVTLPGTSAAPANPESYGAALMRQLMGALTQYQQAQKESPESLTFALVTARRNGMNDVAAELEKKILGKPLDGERPVDGKMKTIEDFLKEGAQPITLLPAPTAPIAPKKKSKKNGAATP